MSSSLSPMIRAQATSHAEPYPTARDRKPAAPFELPAALAVCRLFHAIVVKPVDWPMRLLFAPSGTVKATLGSLFKFKEKRASFILRFVYSANQCRCISSIATAVPKASPCGAADLVLRSCGMPHKCCQPNSSGATVGHWTRVKLAASDTRPFRSIPIICRSEG